jgi:hypothetical protein
MSPARRLAVATRLVVAAVSDADVLGCLDPITLADLPDFRLRVVLAAIRELQQRGAAVDVIAVDDVLAARDARDGTRHADQAGAAFLGVTLCDLEAYGDWTTDARRTADAVCRDVAALRDTTRRLARVMALEETYRG